MLTLPRADDPHELLMLALFDLAVDENPDILRAYPPERIAISGDGLHVAYADSTLHLYHQNGVDVFIRNLLAQLHDCGIVALNYKQGFVV